MQKETVTFTKTFLCWRASLVSCIRKQTSEAIRPHPNGFSLSASRCLAHTKTELTDMQSAPAIWSIAREHQEMTSEARRLAMTARERGEVRFRARLPPHSVVPLSSAAGGCTLDGLLGVLCEEVEGCRQWTSTVLIRHVRERPPQFFAHGGDASTSTSEGEEETECAVDILAGAASTVSAVLNHLKPLRWVLCTLGIFAHTEKSLYKFDKALELMRRLINETIPVEIVTSLAPHMFDLIHCEEQRNEWAELLDKWYQDRVEDPIYNKLRQTIYASRHSLGTRNDVFPCPPLYELNEAELLLVRQRIIAKLERRIYLDSQARQKSSDAALHFRRDCDAHRDMCAEKPQLNEPNPRAPRSKDVWIPRPGTPATLCWRRAALAEWRARRDESLAVLRHALAPGAAWALREGARVRWAALLAPLARGLRATAETSGAPLTSSALLEALLQHAVDEGERATAVELAVFLIASERGNVLEALAALLRVVREKKAVEVALRGVSELIFAHLVDTVLRHGLHPTESTKTKKRNGDDGSKSHAFVTVTDAEKQETAVPHSLHSSGSENGSTSDSQTDTFCSLTGVSLSLSPLVECIVRFQSPRILHHADAILRTFSVESRCIYYTLFIITVRHGDPPATLFTSLPLLFISTLIECFAQSLLDALSHFPARAQRPLPQWLRDALWRAFVPLTVGGLQRYRHTNAVPPSRVVSLCHALVLALSDRWDYSIVPARRLFRRRWRPQGEGEEKHSAIARLIPLCDMCAEYDADAIVARRVVAFAVLLDSVLGAATVNLLRDAETFSRTCSAVGIVVPDIDNSASERMLARLLSLAPSDRLMDTEAHAGVLRCLSLMRHGCTLWGAALKHYERSLVTPQTRGRARVMHFALICVLRCVGEAPIARVWRCALTMRVIAAARAAGHTLSASAVAACLHNYTLRKHTHFIGANEMFRGAPWCDAIEWYNDTLRNVSASPELLRDLPQLQIACLRAMLAQGEWRRALCVPPLPKPFAAEKERVELLQRICGGDRTRSCAVSSQALLQFGSLQDKEKVKRKRSFSAYGNKEAVAVDTQDLCIGGELEALPLFRSAPPYVLPVSFSRERDGTISFCDILDERQREQLPLRSRVRERVSRTFPLLHSVGPPAECPNREQARAEMDTCYANALLPMRRLARVRAERQRNARRHKILKCVPSCNR